MIVGLRCLRLQIKVSEDPRSQYLSTSCLRLLRSLCCYSRPVLGARFHGVTDAMSVTRMGSSWLEARTMFHMSSSPSSFLSSEVSSSASFFSN